MSATLEKAARRLLTQGDPNPAGVVNPEGPSPFFLVCDHAGNAVPAALDRLGLPEEELNRHIAIDIGALEIAKRLSRRLDAALYYQPYSRLVIDSNRQTHVTDSVPAVSDGTEIPANAELSDGARGQRIEEILMPYHDSIEAALQARQDAGRETILVSVHSFTPALRARAEDRPWHVSVMWADNERFGRPVLDELRKEAGLNVGMNEPYTVVMDGDYSIPLHAERRGIDYVEFEMRQDLTATDSDAETWAERLARVLQAARDRYRSKAL
ncbi:N-formylglutamate amidohydrolase [Fodinicurvata halophila]|uniref:N-formylglutamate amidohydrolase n=1 Tax=Fodinicurvata halophila TaxID=1419723 RepID=A0ABV8ULN0_9PROT